MNTLFDLHLVDDAIELLQAAEPKDAPYWGCFSGGKDSCVIKELTRLAGVKVEWHYSVTTLDPPELIRFMSQHHRDVKRDVSKRFRNMAELIEAQGIPTRRFRKCCAAFKEGTTPIGRSMILGIRAAESSRRAKLWDEITYHKKTKADAICPIFRWADDDVWGFIRERGLPYCELYDQGYTRLGCIGCPLATANYRHIEFARWPFAKQLWMKGFRAYLKRLGGQYGRFQSAEEIFEWWISERGILHDCDMALFAGGNE